MIIVTAMMIFQVGTQEVSSSTALTTLQYNQIDQGSGEWSGMPDLKMTDWSRTKSVDDQVDNGAAAVMLAEAEEEGHGSESSEEAGPGGFDRLWDVVSNG
jgi:hypothetical protein